MKNEDLTFNKIYKHTLSQVNEFYKDNNYKEHDIDVVDSIDQDEHEHEHSETFNRHHVCKDIRGIKALLADLEEIFGVSDECSDLTNINIDDLHDHIIDKLNDGVCDRYTSHYIHDNILSNPHLSPEHIFHALWCH